MVKLSIIIPYYKSYEYTKELLDVLTPQLTEETEAILIDDGCNETRLDQYDKIKIIHLKQNGGGAKACNKGLEQAKGEYIALIDSDDMISKDYVRELLKGTESNADIIYMNWKDTYTGAVIQMPDNYAYWKAIYKKDIVPKFVEDYVYHFDVPFYDTIKEKAQTRYYIDKVLYYYNSKRPGNLSERETEFKKEERRKELEKRFKGGNMIKLEVIEHFALGDYGKLTNMERRSIDKPGELFVGDKFCCDKEMADYLLGNNRLNRAFVKIIEIIPEEKKEEKPKRKTKKSTK